MEDVKKAIEAIEEDKAKALQEATQLAEKEAKAYYTYQGPIDSRESDGWKDQSEIRGTKQYEPTGVLTVSHPDAEFSCAVTDSPKLPGILIKVKDSEGFVREVQVFYNSRTRQLIVSTSAETNRTLFENERLRSRFNMPFLDDERREVFGERLRKR